MFHKQERLEWKKSFGSVDNNINDDHDDDKNDNCQSFMKSFHSRELRPFTFEIAEEASKRASRRVSQTMRDHAAVEKKDRENERLQRWYNREKSSHKVASPVQVAQARVKMYKEQCRENEQRIREQTNMRWYKINNSASSNNERPKMTKKKIARKHQTSTAATNDPNIDEPSYEDDSFEDL